MLTFEEWLTLRGPMYAQQIDVHTDALCSAAAMRLSSQFPALCYDPARPDAETFQQHMFRETPRRFHRLMQVVLRVQSLAVVEQEYRWAMTLLPRHGVQAQHLLVFIQIYFEVVRALVPPAQQDAPYVDTLESVIARIVEAVTAASYDP